MKKNWFKLISAILVLIFCFSLFVSVGGAEEKIRLVRTEPGYHKFVLTKGKGVEVCEAYLKRLNKTWFERLPLCDRPENTDVPGFEKLNRVALTPEEIYPIYYRITDFIQTGDQYITDKQSAARRTDVLRPENKVRGIENIKLSMDSNQLSAYRYNPPIDFDNDQKPENLLVWKEIRCGHYESHGGNFPQGGLTVVLVLVPNGSIVDETWTKKLIGHPIGGYPKPDGKGFYDKFRSVGDSMGIFRFKGVTYFDTFFNGWGDFEGKRRESPDIGRTLGVFKREKGQTKQVCEYLWEIPYEQNN